MLHTYDQRFDVTWNLENFYDKTYIVDQCQKQSQPHPVLGWSNLGRVKYS